VLHVLELGVQMYNVYHYYHPLLYAGYLLLPHVYSRCTTPKKKDDPPVVIFDEIADGWEVLDVYY
jgi:hypothetical protein